MQKTGFGFFGFRFRIRVPEGKTEQQNPHGLLASAHSVPSTSA